jgi:outer membrane protein TolC
MAGAAPAQSGEQSGPDLPDILTLEIAKKIALENSPTVAAAQERVIQARERIQQASAAYWPQLDLNASVSRVWTPDNQRIPVPGLESESPEDYFTPELQATWLLFDGFARRFRVLAARHGESQNQQALMDARRLLLSAVASAFFNVQLQRENIAIAEADKGFNLRQVEDAQARYEVGTGSLSDVLNFKVQVNAAQADLIRSQQDYAVALSGLAELLAVPEGVFGENTRLPELGEESEQELKMPQARPLIGYAREHRPDLRLNRYAVEQADAGIGEAKGDYYPSVSMAASVNAERADDPAFESDDLGGSVALVFSYNLFDGGKRRARLNEALSQKAEARQHLRSTRVTVAAEVRQALKTLRAAQKQLKLQRANAKLVRENRDLVEKEYRAGQTSLVRLNEAQRDLTQAQSRLALALVSLRQAWEDLNTRTAQNLIPFFREK